MAGRKALECGLIRRIGDGETTNIWRAHWIPGAIGGKPICPKPGALATRVSELLSEDGSSWNVQALHDNLLPMDVQAVRRIPLGAGKEIFGPGPGSGTALIQFARPIGC